MNGRQIELIDISPEEIQIKSLFTGWHGATEEQARQFAKTLCNYITTAIDREAYINTRLRGTTFAELLKHEVKDLVISKMETTTCLTKKEELNT